MNKLILTVGLPRSGKSTWAKKQGHPIVNRDAIRLALHGRAFIPEAEGMVTAIEDCMVKALFLAGHKTVIVDATHTTYNRRGRWRLPAWELDYKIFTTHQDICKNRAIMDGRGDLIPIIEHMATKCDVGEINNINFP